MRRVSFIVLSLCFWLGAQAQEENTPDPQPNEFVFVDSPPKPLNMERLIQEIGYPQAAVDSNRSGTVVLRVLVDENGDYKTHKVLSEVHPVLLSAVESHVSKLRFTPAILEGKTLKYWVNVPFNFKLQQKSQQEQDIDYFTRYLTENPKSFEAYTQRGLRYLDLGMNEKAVEDLTQAISLNPQVQKKKENTLPFLFFAQYSRGKAHANLEKWEVARQDFDGALGTYALLKKPDSSVQTTIGSVYADRGYIYLNQEKFEQAMKDYDEALKYSPDLKCNIASLKSDVALITDDYPELVKIYNVLLECDPENRFLHYSRAYYKVRSGDYDGALVDYEEVLKRNTLANIRIATYNGMAEAHMKAGRLDKAQEALDQALQVNVLNPQSYYYRALLRIAQQQPTEACQDLEKALSYGLEDASPDLMESVRSIQKEHCEAK